jgi:methionine synthase II (cobalamin-independent)
MQRSTDRIRTTHVGSLARPPALLDLMKAAAGGQPVDPAELAETERLAVVDVVARQHSAGLDVVSDGEQTKTEHPDTIADRILRFAELVGRENVVASADCGFSSQATYTPEIHPTIVWAKFESLAEGARRATARLWP